MGADICSPIKSKKQLQAGIAVPRLKGVSRRVERLFQYHRSMKNRIVLEKYYLPDELERSIRGFVGHYNNHRYHESQPARSEASRRLFGKRPSHSQTAGKHQLKNHRAKTPPASADNCRPEPSNRMCQIPCEIVRLTARNVLTTYDLLPPCGENR